MSTESTPLFRQEVMQAQAGQWLGSIRIGRPLGFSLVTGAAVLMAAGLVSFAIWGEYTRKVTLPGVLIPEGGVMDIASPQPGTVAEVLVREGDSVQAGQALIRLRAERQVAGGELGQLQAAAVAQRRVSLETELRLLEQQTQQRTAALSDRLRSLRSDQLNLQGELEGVQQRVALAAKTARTSRAWRLAASCRSCRRSKSKRIGLTWASASAMRGDSWKRRSARRQASRPSWHWSVRNWIRAARSYSGNWPRWRRRVASSMHAPAGL